MKSQQLQQMDIVLWC